MSESIISSNSDTKKCPFCGEIIKVDAIKCRFCNMALNGYAKNESEGKQVNIQVGIAFNSGDEERNADRTRKKSRDSHFLKNLGEILILLFILIAIIYFIFNCTEFGDRINNDYKQKVDETMHRMENNLKCVSWYISNTNLPPMSLDEIVQFNKKRSKVIEVGGIYASSPSFLYIDSRISFKDAFGYNFLYNVDTVNRKIIITSTGPLGIRRIKNYTKELTY